MKKATGKPLAEYLSEKIWRPVGMEQDGVWMVDGSGLEQAGINTHQGGNEDDGSPAHLLPGIGEDHNHGEGLGIRKEIDRFSTQEFDDVVDDAIPRGKQDQQDAVDNDPGKEMGQIGHGLDQLGESWPRALVQGYREDDRERNTDYELHEAVEQSVPQQFGEVERAEKRGEIVKSYPSAPPDTIQGHEILEGYLAIPDGQIFEDEEITNR